MCKWGYRYIPKIEVFFRKSTQYLIFKMGTKMGIYTVGNLPHYLRFQSSRLFWSIFNRSVGILIGEGPPSRHFYCEKMECSNFSPISTVFLTYFERYMKKTDDKWQIHSPSNIWVVSKYISYVCDHNRLRFLYQWSCFLKYLFWMRPGMQMQMSSIFYGIFQ